MMTYLILAGLALLILSKKDEAGPAVAPVQGIEGTFQGGLNPGTYIDMGHGQATPVEPDPGSALDQAAKEIEQAVNAQVQETTAWLVQTGATTFNRAKEAVNVTVMTGKRGG